MNDNILAHAIFILTTLANLLIECLNIDILFYNHRYYMFNMSLSVAGGIAPIKVVAVAEDGDRPPSS